MKSPQDQKAKKGKNAISSLPVLNPHAASVDLAATEHWVCVPCADGAATDVHRFGSTTRQLREIVELMRSRGVTSVVMESTGVYWIPLYEMLEMAGMEVVLTNARLLKSVPGRNQKSDRIDCQWMQKLHACGLVRGSFRPGVEITAIRTLVRESTNLVEERKRIVARMQKMLDQMNVQVHRAVTDITGTTGMAILRAIVAGVRDPLALAAMRDYRCRKSVGQIAEHLEGTWKEEHLFNLKELLESFDHLEAKILRYEAHIQQGLEALAPVERATLPVPVPVKPKSNKATLKEEWLRGALWRMSGVDLTAIDGIGVELARTILTEVGPRLDAFPTVKTFVSWLHLCPRTSISGGKPVVGKRNGYGSNRIGGRAAHGSPLALA